MGRRGGTAARIGAALALAAGALVVAATAPPVRPAAAAEPIRRIGALRPPARPGDVVVQNVVGTDERNRRLYTMWLSRTLRAHLTEYDLTSEVPRLLRDAELGPSGVVNQDAYNTVVDGAGRRAFLVQAGQVQAIDLRALRVTAAWNVAERVPGFAALGASYGPAEKLLYLVGVLGEADSQDLLASGNRTAAVLALHAADGRLAWYRPLRECAEVLKIPKGGAFVARSARRPGLYVFCTQTAALGLVQSQSALLRLNLPAAPQTATAADVATATVDAFPISGAFHDPAGAGVAGIDLATDRVFVQSQSRSTPGAYVFDGRLDGWVGQVPAPAPTEHGYPRWRGIDPASGRYYMSSPGIGGCTECRTYITATDGRALPVQAGTEQHLPGSVTGLITVDGQTRRLFVPFRANGTDEVRVQVFRDESPPAPAPEPADYDAVTTGEPAEPGSFVFYGASANGFGSSHLNVGGTAGATGDPTEGQVSLPFTPAKGTRGLMSSRLGSANLSESGAGASTTALAGDTNTFQEYDGLTAPTRPGSGTSGWPYRTASCLDGGGSASEPAESGNGGTARGECDLRKGRVHARATYAGVDTEIVSTGATEVTTTLTRDAKRGAVTTSESEARGIGIAIPGGGRVSIASAWTTVATVAAGVRGSAKATWSRGLRGVVVRGPTGAVVYSSPGCATEVTSGTAPGADACAPVVDRLNRVLPDRVRLTLPDAVVTATPKGAFAAVGQTDADYYQEQVVDDQGVVFLGDSVAQRPVPALRIVTYNDGKERSRVVTQLAALEASSIYQISPPEQPFRPPGTPPTAAPSGGPGGGTPGTPGTPGRPGTPGTPGGGGGGGDEPAAGDPPAAAVAAGGLPGLLRRSLGESALTASLFLLFGAAALTPWRRRRLVRAVEADL